MRILFTSALLATAMAISLEYQDTYELAEIENQDYLMKDEAAAAAADTK